jgi:hypothetical protein
MHLVRSGAACAQCIAEVKLGADLVEGFKYRKCELVGHTL